MHPRGHPVAAPWQHPAQAISHSLIAVKASAIDNARAATRADSDERFTTLSDGYSSRHSWLR